VSDETNLQRVCVRLLLRVQLVGAHLEPKQRLSLAEYAARANRPTARELAEKDEASRRLGGKLSAGGNSNSLTTVAVAALFLKNRMRNRARRDLWGRGEQSLSATRPPDLTYAGVSLHSPAWPGKKFCSSAESTQCDWWKSL
jgi:hypothetical protein